MTGSRKLALVLTLAVTVPGCFQVDTQEGPSAVPNPRLVKVLLEYRQPNGCLNVVSSCEGPVVFFGSWMRAGTEFALYPTPDTFVWTGTAIDVPVNFPPRDQPYLVRVFDPYLRDTPTGGVTAMRLKVGTQAVTTLDSFGTPYESAYVYIDDVGIGHNP
jgi:hypothetical protein